MFFGFRLKCLEMVLEGNGVENLGCLDVNSGAHRVTCPTIHREATSPVAGWRFKAQQVLFRGFWCVFNHE